MQSSQMERSNSQMEMGGPRSGSPSNGDAPSPKRARLEGGMPQMPQARPGQPGQMPAGSQVGYPPNSPPSYEALPAHTRELVFNHQLDPILIPHEQLSDRPHNTLTLRQSLWRSTRKLYSSRCKPRCKERILTRTRACLSRTSKWVPAAHNNQVLSMVTLGNSMRTKEWACRRMVSQSPPQASKELTMATATMRCKTIKCN